MFDTFIIVDWSAASRPKQGRDSIWICRLGADGETFYNPPTRHAAKELLADMLAGASARGERVIAGFDFPFGYPAGFAARLGLMGTPWRALWDEISTLVDDQTDNRNNRFHVGATLNRRVTNGKGRFPFWGCPVGFTHDFLGPRHHRGHTEDEPLQERRVIDKWMVGAQPCWKLAYTGSVGSQSLTGIPVVRDLRGDPRWADRARIWPFETGLSLPADAQFVFAEVWPSWWRDLIRPDHGPPNDKAQVRTVAEIFAARDRAGELAAWFEGDPDLSAEQHAKILAEEAWTLGVTAPRRLAKSLAPQRSSSFPRKRQSSGPWTPAFAGVTTEESDANTKSSPYTYLRDPAAIYRRSFALVRAEADLARFPLVLCSMAVRLAHAAGDVAILDHLAWSRGAVNAGRRALAKGAAILVDSEMVASGIVRPRLPAQNPVICTLRDPAVPALAASHKTTRSAAAVELWRPHLAGAVIAIGNAPTALFRLLEILVAGADKPALIVAFPVGFVGAAEAKEALIGCSRGLAYVTLKGRRGGSALAAAAVNALCSTARP